MNRRGRSPEMPHGLRVLRSFTVFLSGVFGLAAIFTLIMLLFAPGPIRVEDRTLSPSEFRGLGSLVAAASALIAIATIAASVGISQRRGWFRAVLVGLAALVVAGGAIANLTEGSLALALATLGLGTPAVVLVWVYLYRNATIRHYLDE